ncbi:ROK family protein [Clostridium weizhouense]|uniref:ROK family protein n=1 Tax=Clostridium weizhouense TaxID=2859781 RepID=A0ABS7AN48_9CLOT|nr:ROK family protein [Clostridium weizhouense]MBW6410093.1 ROK family protein [Clostridium weizhouense]
MSKISGKPKELKRVNISLILEFIRNNGSASRTEIVKGTGISQTTVGKLLLELQSSNDIINTGLDKSSGGRRAERYSLNKNKSYILSLLINGKYVIYNLVNGIGDIIESNKIETSELLDKIIIDNLIESFIKNDKDIKAIGICVPGIVSENGYLSGRTFSELKEIDINIHIQEKYNIPVVLENDLNSAALGFLDEYVNNQKNNIKECLNMVYINFNKLGAGAGIIINNKLVKGKDNFAGEIGFIKLGDQRVNELLQNNPTDKEYIDIVVNILSIINYILNPSLIVLGGDDFRYNLIEKIKKNYKENNIKTEIFIVKDDIGISFKGINKTLLNLINNDVKLIKNL